MLIPDARGDVLGLLEAEDEIINICKKILLNLSIEHPEIPKYLNPLFLKLVDYSVNSVEELIKASRAYFTDFSMVNNYIQKTNFYENEVDKVEEQLKRAIFEDKDLEKFSTRMHIRYFVEKMALMSDEAERISDKLSVYAIKRTI